MLRIVKYLAILLLILGFALLTANCTYADKIINTNSKKLELPSKIHKDGEGFYEIGRMLTPRYRHSSILLKDGRVFIVGGYDNKDNILNSTEIFDPKTGKSFKGPDMPYIGFGYTLKRLSNGNILIVGGKPNHRNGVFIYLPKNNKIIETDDTLSNGIILRAAIAEISNEDVFINDSYHISKKFGFGIYNKQTNKLSIKHSETIPETSFDYYIGNINNVLYFLSIHGKLGLNIVEIISNNDSSNFDFKELQYVFDLKPINGYQTSHGILLGDNKTLFIYNNYNDGYILFDTKTKSFKKVIPNVKLGATKELSLLKNGNIIFFNVSKNSINIIELNPYNGHGITKSYTSPILSIELVSVLKLDGDNLLFIGGAEYSPAGYITFGHIYGASDKIYLWKTKKENN